MAVYTDVSESELETFLKAYNVGELLSYKGIAEGSENSNFLLQTTGGTDIIANWLSMTGSTLPGWGALALIMVAAMAVTPFLNNAATVLVMAPIAATFATELGYQPEAFLLAVAIGAGCDFLTPIGHQCNTLVMGPGGYKFGDYWRLGLPLSFIVVLVAVPMLMLVWPF